MKKLPDGCAIWVIYDDLVMALRDAFFVTLFTTDDWDSPAGELSCKSR
jgi:hypothetical protein